MFTSAFRMTMTATGDQDAAAYIAAVELAKGSAVTTTQRDAINAFVVGEKTSSRWTLHKRLYLPIWADAAANAICMTTRTSGSFPNGATHGSGYVQGNGTNQYFNTGVSISGIGTTGESLLWGVLIQQANSTVESRGFVGAYENETPSPYLGTATAGIRSRMYNAASQVVGTLKTTGIVLGGRENGRAVLRHRGSSGYTSLNSTTVAIGGTLPTRTMVAMAIDHRFWFSDARFGAFFYSLGMVSADSDAFTLGLKTMWETCTGLTLP